MDEPVRILRPEQKHGEADAERRSDNDVTNLSMYKTLAEAISKSGGCVDTAPLTLYTVTTREYCIVPCPYSDTDPNVIRVLQYMRGQGWVAELYRLSESLENPSKYRQAILVCWDPKVIQACYSPRYYSAKGLVKTPCGMCTKYDRDKISECQGCPTLRVWLASTTVMKTTGDPCAQCQQNKNRPKGGQATCEGCPAKQLYDRLYAKAEGEGEASENTESPKAEEAQESVATPDVTPTEEVS